MGSTDLGTSTETTTTEGDLGTTDLGTETATEEKPPAEDPYKDFRGPPEEGKYEPFVLPDGAVADEALSSEFLPIVKELGLSQKGAQKLVDFKTKLDEINMQRWGEHLSDLRTQAKADPEIGGAKYTENLSVAVAAVKKFGGPALQKVLNQYGVGAHPEMIRAFAKIGRAMGETPGLDSGGGSGVNNAKPLHELMYGSDSSAKT